MTGSGRRWPSAAALSLVFVVFLNDVVGLVVPGLIRPIPVSSPTSLTWLVISYNLALVVLLPVGAVAAARFPLGTSVAGPLGLALASAFCATAPGSAWLVAGRAGQGAAGALLLPMLLPATRGGRVLRRAGLTRRSVGGAARAALCCSPILVGGVTALLGWRWVFWLDVPLALAAVGVTAPADRGGDDRVPGAVRLDLGAFLALGCGSLASAWAVVTAIGAGWGSPMVVVSLAVGGLLLAVFVSGELPLGLFRIRAIALADVTYTCVVVVLYGTLFLAAQYVEAALRYGPMAVGVRLLPLTVLPLAFGPVVGPLVDRFGPSVVTAVGLAITAAGLGLFVRDAGPAATYPPLSVALALSGCGLALALPAAGTSRAAVRIRRADASAEATSALRLLAGVLGLGVLGAVLAGRGGYASSARVVSGLDPALVALVVLAVAGVAAAVAGGVAARSRRAPHADRADPPASVMARPWPERADGRRNAPPGARER